MFWTVQQPPVLYDKSAYKSTGAGGISKIATSARFGNGTKIYPKHPYIIEANVSFRDDLAEIHAGKFCIFGENCVIQPSMFDKKYVPIRIGQHCIIEAGSSIEAAKIQDCVHIGKNCVIGRQCVLSSCCRIEV
jgi:dynactin-5